MPAGDGYVVPSVQGSQPWSVVAELIGLEELKDEKFASGSGRIEHGEELKELLIKGLAEWERKPLFQASGERRLVFGMAHFLCRWRSGGRAGDGCTTRRRLPRPCCPHLRERKISFCRWSILQGGRVDGRLPGPGAALVRGEAGPTSTGRRLRYQRRLAAAPEAGPQVGQQVLEQRNRNVPYWAQGAGIGYEQENGTVQATEDLGLTCGLYLVAGVI